MRMRGNPDRGTSDGSGVRKRDEEEVGHGNSARRSHGSLDSSNEGRGGKSSIVGEKRFFLLSLNLHVRNKRAGVAQGLDNLAGSPPGDARPRHIP